MISVDTNVQTAKRRVGLLVPGDRAYPTALAFAQALADCGYGLGRDLELDVSYADGQLQRLPELAAAMAKRRPDVIVAIGAVTFYALRDATSEIPLVFCIVLDAVEAGLVADAQRPAWRRTSTASCAIRYWGTFLSRP